MKAVQIRRQDGGSALKRSAIVSAALEVFARDGFSRARVEDIAQAASVSTRTVYNHFQDKSALFAAVVEISATATSHAYIATIDGILGAVADPDDLESALISCAMALRESVPPEHPHWGLVRHLHADAAHVSVDVADTWRQVGPARVNRQIALHFSSLTLKGLLRLADPDAAAEHYIALIRSTWGSEFEPRVTEEHSARQVELAVRTFLYGYSTVPRDTGE
ncbi:MAG: TetR/AcrR family transcriptional regulator [Candidatus Leucobacter sulfamidivorax]|nr:TetR/AcrR family transcriptional regulator [Candidatus Leucobacter sulfamidivorax]